MTWPDNVNILAIIDLQLRPFDIDRSDFIQSFRCLWTIYAVSSQQLMGDDEYGIFSFVFSQSYKDASSCFQEISNQYET